MSETLPGERPCIACGGPPGRPLCSTCWLQLPKEVRVALGNAATQRERSLIWQQLRRQLVLGGTVRAFQLEEAS